MSDEKHSESELYYPDELEFQENFDENEEPTSKSWERADADQSEGNNARQEEIETFTKEQKSENMFRKTFSDMKTLNQYLSSMNKNVQVLDFPAADLDRILSKFFKDVRKVSGEEYEPHTLSGFQ